MTIKIPEQNQVILTGRLTRDPQSAYTQKGNAVCYFDIAVNRRYKDSTTNEWKEETTYVPIITWGAVAEKCKDKLKKGSPVHIEGRLVTTEYSDKDGKKIKRLKVVGRRVQFLSVAGDKDPGAEIEEPELEEPSEGVSDPGIDEVPF